MTRVFAASLVVLLATSTAWAQDSPVVNRLDTHPDWLFQPDRGGGPSPPDTLDPWRYYSLAVGNAWESRNVDGETFRIDIGASHIFQCVPGNCVPNPGRTETILLDALSYLFADSVLTAQVTPTAIPEPSVLSLLLFGLLIAGRRFCKR